MSSERPLSPAEQREVMETAWRLQGEAEARARSVSELDARVRAGKELGLDPAHLKEAEALVRMQAEGRAIQAHRTRTRAGLLVALAGVVVLGAAVGGVLVVRQDAAVAEASFSETFSAAAWRLETSPGTRATVAYADGEATVQVEQFTPMADGRYWANLEQDTPRDWPHLRSVRFSVRGDGLANLRLYLENPTERWRGPVVPVTTTWQTHTLPLSAFEHQQKDGGWRVVEDQLPKDVKTTSFKLGWYVNEPDARGSVTVKDLHAE